VDWAAVPKVSEPRSARGRATRQRIILAATDLFAERGISAVGVGEILDRAGQSNASAIQYHFGSREGLIVAVLEPRPDVREPMERDREAMLDVLLLSGTRVTLDDAVLALVRPSLHALGTHDGRAFLRVAGEVTRALPLEDRVDPGLPSTRRAMALVGSRMPEVPGQIRLERLAAAFTLIVELVANRAREIELGLAPHLDDPTFESELVAMAVGLLTAPTGQGSRPG
jgi:AcrR family transcriptional regulator